MRTEKLNKATSVWWNSLDMTDTYLIKLYSGMFGTAEQRVKQLYIVRNNLNFRHKRKIKQKTVAHTN